MDTARTITVRTEVEGNPEIAQRILETSVGFPARGFNNWFILLAAKHRGDRQREGRRFTVDGIVLPM